MLEKIPNFVHSAYGFLLQDVVSLNHQEGIPKGEVHMNNYKVTIKATNMILGYVVKESPNTDDAFIRACRCAKFECGIQAEDILEVVVSPL